ncbi:hypothetical protein Tsubulata_039286 [Turnera subulata]|uniref:Uncharacterized protein n=1 Tax=Turnera subulata TaxID=218843 RepID=A0A9Q0GGJ3_9ROSI|nr:hypothetical protein Tsubulata_039286 [Turnera subulata]
MQRVAADTFILDFTAESSWGGVSQHDRNVFEQHRRDMRHEVDSFLPIDLTSWTPNPLEPSHLKPTPIITGGRAYFKASDVFFGKMK